MSVSLVRRTPRAPHIHMGSNIPGCLPECRELTEARKVVRRWSTERLLRTEKARRYLLTLSDAIRPPSVKARDRAYLMAIQGELARRPH